MSGAVTWNGLITAVVVVFVAIICAPLLIGIFLGGIQCVIVFIRDEVLRRPAKEESEGPQAGKTLGL